jgi:hypothetical protein
MFDITIGGTGFDICSDTDSWQIYHIQGNFESACLLKKVHELQTMVLSIIFSCQCIVNCPPFIISKSRFAFEITIDLFSIVAVMFCTITYRRPQVRGSPCEKDVSVTDKLTTERGIQIL